MDGTGSLNALDWSVIALYFALVFGVAIAAGRRGRGSQRDFFLAGRNVGWFVVGASIFASNIGSEHLVGLAGTAAAPVEEGGGVPVAQFEIMAGLVLLLLAWLFAPFYLRSGVFTMPEFLERRYSAGPRAYLAWLSVVGYVLTKISVTIAAGGIVFETLMGVPFWTGAILIVLITGAYTVWGGLRVVLYTDMVQMFILLGGALCVSAFGLSALGGVEGMRAAVAPEALSLWRGMNHPEFPWTGILFGAPILAVWYWCTDQFIVQRVLSAHGLAEARRGALFAAYLKQLPLFLFVLPGVIALALSNTGRLELAESDAALPALITALLPGGLRGLVAAGLLAALMSSLSSTFNSCSTIITVDIYRRMHPRASEPHLVRVGQLATIGMVGLALLWIPNMNLVGGTLFIYLQSVQAYIAPPIAAVFLLGVLWRGATAWGASAALAVGALLGLSRLLLEMSAGRLGEGTLLRALADENFLHIAIGIFAASVAVLVAVSLIWPRPQPAGAGYGLREAAAPGAPPAPGAAQDTPERRRQDALLSAGVVVLILALWAIFS
ncbi:MAG: sodium:solute symporter [Deltaproteobacteria bacterium]|nr:sodium:solute symporter [Deltaproteobacteria bacterium]MDD9828064.1 sodium:solute symporter [Deltaproteobacteria bacterium]MDD9853149.1 sodium:solute symporter [Deltaproteobacteria bacterium]MDD9873371.1 sodium:solute symporter [Deltaproteobacteria bacterium]